MIRSRLRCRAARPGAAARSLLLALAAALLVVAGMPIARRVLAVSRPVKAETGFSAPDFTLEEVGTGKKVQLSSLRGKPVILSFFCGCGLCRAAAIRWSEMKDKIPDAQMIAVLGDHDAYNPVTVKDFKWGTGWEWPVLADVGTVVTLKYESISCPRCWVIDSNGIIRHHNKDRNDPPDTIVNGAIAAVQKLKKS